MASRAGPATLERMQRRDFIQALAGVGGLAGLAWSAEASACLWDYDTLAQEALGVPDVVLAIAGGFVRNPPKYYEMRVERVTELVGFSPDRYEAYDDLAVACDRLGRSDEAIAWMAKKKQALERLDITPEPGSDSSDDPWYRYHANLGTFHAHRWFHAGTHFDALDDLRRARREIAKAIELNADAHFGRETYQLQLIEWLLTQPKMPKRERHNEDQLPIFLPIERGHLEEIPRVEGPLAEQLDDAVEGLSGLITMGAAWRSFDVFAALAYVLAAREEGSLAQFASYRCLEILEQGGRSLVAGLPRYRGGNNLDGEPILRMLPLYLGNTHREQYEAIRAKAKAWTVGRDAYINERLDRGEHPDTHRGFWDAFEGEPSRMYLDQLGIELEDEVEDEDRPGQADTDTPSGCSGSALAGGAVVSLLLGSALTWMLTGKRRAQPQSKRELAPAQSTTSKSDQSR